MSAPSLRRRSSGVLLPLASLPGRGAVGDLGRSAYDFVDFLAASRQRWWQMLPTQPIGEGFSPYRSPSAFAGGPLYISAEELRRAGWLNSAHSVSTAQGALIDYRTAQRQKENTLRLAFKTFQRESGDTDRDALDEFIEKEKFWLPDYALFMALRRSFKNRPWTAWPSRYRDRTAAALTEARAALSEEIRFRHFVQWQFELQWDRLRNYAAKRGVGLIGDAPIFVSPDSADVWANPKIFRLKKNGLPDVVAGVPPDYFSKTGQLWGNPTYRWDVLAKDGYRWWIERLRRTFTNFDAVRLDHFIGFVRAYEVPSEAKTAIHGRYRPGPGAAFFRALERALPTLQLIAEDLGAITPEVIALRRRFKFPGMHILQFEWEKPMIEAESVAYTGTHDNDTTRGWFESLTKDMQAKVSESLGAKESVSWALVEKTLRSPARTAIIPVQDLLDLGSAHRVNTPGTARGNWRWRLDEKMLTKSVGLKLKKLTAASGR